jgi:hypothetical protein
VELGTVSVNAVLGKPGAGMSFVPNKILQDFAKNHPDAVSETVIDAVAPHPIIWVLDFHLVQGPAHGFPVEIED